MDTSTPTRGSPAVARRVQDTQQLDMGATNGSYSPQRTVKIADSPLRAASSLDQTGTRLPEVKSRHRSTSSLGKSPSKSPFGGRRRPQKPPERCQFTGRKLGNRPWEGAFQAMIKDLMNQDPGLTVVRCSDDPEGARLIPAGVAPETKEEPPQVPQIDTRTKVTPHPPTHASIHWPARLSLILVRGPQAWKLVYGKSKKADVEYLAEAAPNPNSLSSIRVDMLM